MYKAIGFDLGGVIIHYSVPDVVRDLAWHFKVQPGVVADAFHEYRPALDVDEINADEFWRRVVKRVDPSANPADSRHFWSEDYVTKNPVIKGMLPLVDGLRQGGYKTGILSNIDREHAEINYGRRIFEHFDVTLLSDELHHRKPERAAFAALAEQLGASFAELIFIDDLAENIAAANRYGISGILFENREQVINQLQQLGVKTGN